MYAIYLVRSSIPYGTMRPRPVQTLVYIGYYAWKDQTYACLPRTKVETKSAKYCFNQPPLLFPLLPSPRLRPSDLFHHRCVRPAKRSKIQLQRSSDTHLALVLGNGQLGLGRHARAVRARDSGRAPRSTARDLVDVAEELVGVAEGDKDDCRSVSLNTSTHRPMLCFAFSPCTRRSHPCCMYA